MITILSPAKTLDFENRPAVSQTTTPALIDEAAVLNGVLSEYEARDLKQLMKISDSIASLNVRRNAAWSVDAHHNDEETRPALFAFNGDVYRGLAAGELAEDDVTFAQEHLRILSGLYGVLRPLDRMMPYRLEMGSRLSTSRGETLYDFWGTTIADTLRGAIEATGSKVLVNLASQEYFKSVDRDRLGYPVVTPHFKEQRSGGPRVIGVHAKRQRGRMARYIVENRIDTPEVLKAYDLDDYAYSEDLSTDTDWVFLR